MLSGAWAGGGRLLAALFGTRIAAGSTERESPATRAPSEPDWVSELDEYEGVDGFWLASCPEIGAVVAARISGSAPAATPAPAQPAPKEAGPGQRARRVARRRATRRARCPKTER